MEIKIRRWRHKESGKEYNVLPWWDCHASLVDASDSSEILGDKDDEWKDRLYAVGALCQIGWLMENEEGVWFGVGPKIRDHFNEIES